MNEITTKFKVGDIVQYPATIVHAVDGDGLITETCNNARHAKKIGELKDGCFLAFKPRRENTPLKMVGPLDVRARTATMMSVDGNKSVFYLGDMAPGIEEEFVEAQKKRTADLLRSVSTDAMMEEIVRRANEKKETK